MSEEKKNELNASDSGRSPGSDVGGACPDRLFALLDRQTQISLIKITYLTCLFLGSILAILAFGFEFWAQTHKLPFEMHDWMITIVFALLSFTGVGAIWHSTRVK